MADHYTLRYGSLEYLPVRVVATKEGEVYDPTADTVQIALPEINEDPTTWYNAFWDTIIVDDTEKYIARILVGPSGNVNPARGDYDILVKITDTPEVPMLRAGRLTIK